MGRSVIVLGVPRSGTSVVAGMLHAMGVDMGAGHLQPADQFNARGYFEDLRWQKINKQVTGLRYGMDRPASIPAHIAAAYEALAGQCDRKELWGMKDPRLCFTFGFIWHYLDDPRVVAVSRDPSASARSLAHHSRSAYEGKHAMDVAEAERVLVTWGEAMEDRLLDFPGAVLSLAYEDILRKPEDTARRLGRFAFDALLREPDLAAAVAFVDRGLNHHG